MLIKTQGIVIKQRSIGENDRILTILTKDYGILEASARGVKRIKNQLAGASQILCYSEFCLYRGKNYYSINSAQLIESFYHLRLDVVKLALACYFCDLAYLLVPSGEQAWDELRFLLNCLFFLQNEKKSQRLLKSIYELRMMSICGFMPDLTCCAGCATYESEQMYFLPVQSRILCKECLEKQSKELVKWLLPPAVLQAMRQIIYAEDKQMFGFQLVGHSLEQLNFITEEYTFLHTNTTIKSLQLYKQMIQTNP